MPVYRNYAASESTTRERGFSRSRARSIRNVDPAKVALRVVSIELTALTVRQLI